VTGLMDVAATHHIPLQAKSLGGMFGFCFTSNQNIRNQGDVAASDDAMFCAFYHGMLDAGVYLAPSRFEAGFVSSTHRPADIEYTLQAADQVLSSFD